MEGSAAASRVVVVDYDPGWPRTFERLCAHIAPAVGDIALAVEHVGSTAVPGLAAKPVIDIDIVVDAADLRRGIERLVALGYRHRGDLGIAGREAFRWHGNLPRHNLYMCAEESRALANHRALRDYLRAHPDAVAAYGALKRELARLHPDDIDRYVEGKTEFILGILRQTDFPDEELDAIEAMNRASRN